MDSWSRPSKHQATPPPLYLVPGGEATPYCKSCGRTTGSRKTQAASTPAKYCSSRCRNRKPGKLDREIEEAFVTCLNGCTNTTNAENSSNGAAGVRNQARKMKGDPRVLVPLTTVEIMVFGDRHDPEKAFGRKKNRLPRGMPDEEEWKTVDMVDDPEFETTGLSPDEGSVDGDRLARMSIRSGTRIRPPQVVSEVNGGVGGEKGRAERVEETEEMLGRRKAGSQRAHEREMVRCAARRGIAFGFVVNKAAADELEGRRKCEALMQEKVVESSFAKGDWSIRWRE